jgi:dimethylhistidine N-methyltransferase
MTSFADDVKFHLQRVPRRLPSQYLYDTLGSALFDAICELPWYGITRAELGLLDRHRGEIVGRIPGLTTIVELGPGDGRKLQALTASMSAPTTVHLVDLSPEALARASQALSQRRNMTVIAHRASFEEGLAGVSAVAGDPPPLVLFLGSNIGNFDPPDAVTLLRRIRTSLPSGAALLLGADLVKPEQDLLAAYDDPLGVSAAFNLNVLLRINRELGGTFDLRAFRHRAVWNSRCSRMEMYAVSTTTQRVRISAIDLDLDLEQGEAIWTESSYKYTVEECARQIAEAGFHPVAQWLDRDYGFALLLAS